MEHQDALQPPVAGSLRDVDPLHQLASVAINDPPAVTDDVVVSIDATAGHDLGAGRGCLIVPDPIHQPGDTPPPASRIDQLDVCDHCSFKRSAPLLGIRFVPGREVGGKNVVHEHDSTPDDDPPARFLSEPSRRLGPRLPRGSETAEGWPQMLVPS